MNKIHKMEVQMNKAEAKAYQAKRKVRKVISSWKTKMFAVSLGVTGALVLMYVCFYNVSNWYDTHRVKFYTPIVLQPMVKIEERKVATQSAIVQIKPITDPNLAILNELYRKVRWNESNAGMNKKDPNDLHNYCQRIGRVNEIGWIPKKGEMFCFEDEGEQWATFKRVFASRLAVMTVNEALCVHNTGVKQPMCLFSMEIDKVL